MAALVAAATLAAACTERPRVAADDRERLAAGLRTADSLAATPRLDDAGVVAAGYFERLRLGLGSPFRLAEQAASDPRLPGGFGRQVAWGLLARTARGELVALDATALGEDPAPAFGLVTDGTWHRATIDSVVRTAPTARTGEEAVRVGYALARAEGLVSAGTASAAVYAAALARDRRLAVEDATRLLAESRVQDTYDALDLVPVWRDGRRLRSEAPLMADALAPDPSAAVREAERLLAHVRQASAIIGAEPSDSVASLVKDEASGLALEVARRLAALPSVRDAYPLSPVVVTLGGYRQAEVADSLEDEGAPATERRVRVRLITRARTDELLAAEWAVARAALPAGSAARRELAGLVQAAAVAIRPWAQAPVDAGPATNDAAVAADQAGTLQLRDGVRALVFERGTPVAWQVAATRQFGSAVADLRGVLPDLTLDGLTVRVAESPRRGLALALHEPRSRTVYLPPATSGGTVAHELVHDLDAQAAATHLAMRGVYGTDRLTRTGGSGDLARAVRALAATTPTGRARTAGVTPPGALAFDADRPAERLARGADFFVAAALAREGRSNGVLSAVQDGTLTGFAGVTAPEPGDGAAEALVSVLDEVTFVPPATRQWYLARYGARGVRSPLSVAQFALHAQPAWDGERTLRASGLPMGLTARAPDGRVAPGPVFGACGGVGGGAGAPWQARLLWLAADARARGYVRARAAHAATVGAWWGWNARGILGAPWRPESADLGVARTRDAMLRAAMAAARRASGACALVSP